MSPQTSLKAQNAWLIWAALLIHALAFVYVVVEPFALAHLPVPDALEKAKAAMAPGTLSLAVIVLVKLVLLGILPAWLRDRLIHWRWRHPLPGARAFTKFGPADPRVDMGKLESRYGPLPTDPRKQDIMFYKIYRANAGETGVLDAHKSYLATRDIGIINLLMFVLLPGFAYWATGDSIRTGIYAAILLLSYATMSLAAQIYGARLVENTLAAASTD